MQQIAKKILLPSVSLRSKSIAGIDTKGLDGFLANHGIASHQGNPNIDKTTYDWANCALTKVKWVGRANSARYKSTRLASEAYVASSFSEIGNL